MMNRFTTMFLGLKNIHLIKDVGMIPYLFGQSQNMNAEIVCYQNDDYDYTLNEVKGLKLHFIRKTRSQLFDGLSYLFFNARNIDYLNLYHLRVRTFIWIAFYKLLNPHGSVYLKLDTTNVIKNPKYSRRNIINTIKFSILKKCSLISVESTSLHQYLSQNWPVKIEYIPNGFYDFNARHKLPDTKENIILSVGKIGDKNKSNETLVEAYIRNKDALRNWQIVFVGEIEPQFHKYIADNFEKCPELVDRIILKGPIYDRKLLDLEYKRSKIFCMTSYVESFGLVFLEAMSYGCYVITSNVVSAADVTKQGTLGDIFEAGNVDELSSLLLKRCLDVEYLESQASPIMEYAYDSFYWPRITDRIFSLLKK